MKGRFDPQDVGTAWDGAVAPGGQVCAECGTPVESEPCWQHWAQALADRLDAVAALLPTVPAPTGPTLRCPCGCGAPGPCGVAQAVWALHGLDPAAPPAPAEQDPLPLTGLQAA